MGSTACPGDSGPAGSRHRTSDAYPGPQASRVVAAPLVGYPLTMRRGLKTGTRALLVVLVLALGTFAAARMSFGRYEDTLLHRAVQRDSPILVRLLAPFSDLQATDSGSHTPLDRAAIQCNTDIVRALVQWGAAERARSTPLVAHLRIQAHKPRCGADRSLEIVRMLLDAGVPADDPAAILVASHKLYAQPEELATLELLLDNGADAGTRDASGNTPLHETHDPRIATILIHAGAPVNAVNNEGATPLFAASAEVSRVLLAAGAVVDARDPAGQTPLHHRARRYDGEETQILIDAGADVEAVDRAGQTALHVAAKRCNRAVAAVLLGAGADAKRPDNDGQTPAELALASGCPGFERR